MKTKLVRCPDCNAKAIRIFDDLEVGDIVGCEVCDAEFEIISLTPIKLRAVNEDYEDDYEDDEDDMDY